MKKLLGLSMGIGLTLLTVCPLSINSACAEEPVYKPQVTGGESTRRIGGGTRSFGQYTPPVVLAPQQVGHTLNTQPSLYWLMPDATDKPLIVTVACVDAKNPKCNEPLLEVKVAAVKGVQSLDLAKYKKKLDPNLEYEWSVTILVGAKQSSSDIVSTASVMYVVPSTDLSAQLAKATEKEKPLLYAKQGLWYHAIASLSDLIAKYPDDKTFRQQRATLLEQVDLKEAAAYDRKS